GLEDPSMNQYNNPYYQQGDRYLDMVTCVGYITDQFQSILFSRTYSYLNENPTCKFYREDVIGPHNTIIRFYNRCEANPPSKVFFGISGSNYRAAYDVD
ncbi:hypothetical protein ACW4FQ_30835, partial [Escherichia coli]